MTASVQTVVETLGLRKRILRAGGWILAGQLASQFIRFATNVVLTRVLFPDAFGLMAVASLLITALGLFSDIGVARSIVQTKRTDPAMLDTAWTLHVIRGQFVAGGCIVAAIAFCLASHFGFSKAGTVYGDVRLPWLVGFFALSPAISSLDSIRTTLAQRDMRVHLLIKLDLTAQVTATLVMVITGYLTHSYWTLLAGAVTNVTVRCAAGHIFLPGHRERFRIDRQALAELMTHGRWIMLSSILTFVSMNGDRLLLGGLLPSAQFGLYTIALLIGMVPQGLATSLAESVIYPAVSEVFRERPASLPSVIMRFQLGYDAILTTLFSLLITAGPSLIQLVYDKRYDGAGWMISILSIGFIGFRYQVVEQCYQAVGKPKFVAFANFLRLAALIIGVLIGRKLGGISGTIMGIAVSYYAAWPLALWFKIRYGIWSWRSELLFLPCIAIGLVAGVAVHAFLHACLPHRIG